MSQKLLGGYTESNAEESWKSLEDAITKIYEKKVSNLSYEELYRHAYNLVLNRFGEKAYKNLQQAIRHHLTKNYLRLPQAQEDSFLPEFNEVWKDAIEMMKAIARIFLYMDRNYIPQNTLTPLNIVGFQLFLQVFFEEPNFSAKFTQQVILQIRKERDGIRIDRFLIKNLLGMLIELSTKSSYVEKSGKSYSAYNTQGIKNQCVFNNDKMIYQKYFEEQFLADSDNYYQEEAQSALQSLTPTEYLLKAEVRSQEEIERADVYLDILTKKPLIYIFINAYLLKNSRVIAEMEGLNFFFHQERLEDIRRLYHMFLLNDEALKLFHNAFQNYQNQNLIKILNTSNEEEKDPLIVTKNLIDFHKKVMRICVCLQEKDFEREKIIYKIVRDCFEHKMNTGSRVIFNLNIFLDHQFREGFKCLKDSEVEGEINDILAIFRYITDKDIFEKGYKNFLSKRLLTGKSLSEENEKLFVARLQQECGCYYTAKIEIMFKDMSLSTMTVSEFQTKYGDHPAFNQMGESSLSIKAFDVKILTTGNWPFQEGSGTLLPSEVETWAKLFKEFYLNKHPGRNLKWILSQGSAEIKATFGGKKKELLVTTYQMCILLSFNQQKTLSVREILAKTMLPQEEVISHLEVFLGLKIVNKVQGEGKEISQEDVMEINDQFVHKSYRIKIPLKKTKEKGVNDEKEMKKIVTIERKYWIEACIVRIMKSRKTLDHSTLLEEVMKLITLHQFKPDIPLIKTVIEELIAKEYIERSPHNKTIYNYIS